MVQNNVWAFIFFSFALALLTYAVVYFQLLFMHKILKLGMSERIIRKLCIAASLSSFAAAFLLLYLKSYLGLHLNTGGV